MFSSFSFNVQKEILLSKFTGSEISLLVAINNVVTTFALLNHRPFPGNNNTVNIEIFLN